MELKNTFNPNIFRFKRLGSGGNPKLSKFLDPILNVSSPKSIPIPATPKPYRHPNVSPKYAHSTVATKAPRLIPI